MRKFVDKFCKAEEDGDVKDTYNYGTFYHLADLNLNLQGFLVSDRSPHLRLWQALMFSKRGTAKTYHVQQSKELGCPIGAPCGDCECCVGLCLADICIGGCV